MATANITPTALSDGSVYCSAAALPVAEATLGDGTVADPIAIVEGQSVVAVVRLSINGFITANSTYVVLQTDLGDGTWIDVAWLLWDQVQGSATFVLCGGGLGRMNNAFQQSRNSGEAPTASGSNVVPLGGRCRFVGQTIMSGGSSSAPGVTTAVTATITYKLQPPR